MNDGHAINAAQQGSPCLRIVGRLGTLQGVIPDPTRRRISDVCPGFASRGDRSACRANGGTGGQGAEREQARLRQKVFEKTENAGPPEIYTKLVIHNGRTGQ